MQSMIYFRTPDVFPSRLRSGHRVAFKLKTSGRVAFLTQTKEKLGVPGSIATHSIATTAIEWGTQILSATRLRPPASGEQRGEC